MWSHFPWAAHGKDAGTWAVTEGYSHSCQLQVFPLKDWSYGSQESDGVSSHRFPTQPHSRARRNSSDLPAGVQFCTALALTYSHLLAVQWQLWRVLRSLRLTGPVPLVQGWQRSITAKRNNIILSLINHHVLLINRIALKSYLFLVSAIYVGSWVETTDS